MREWICTIFTLYVTFSLFACVALADSQLLDKGLELEKMGEIRKAILLYEKNVDKTGVHSDEESIIIKRLMLLYDKIGDSEKAIEYGQRLAKEHPDSEMIHADLSDLYLKSGKYANALSELEKYENLSREHNAVYGPGWYLPWTFSLPRARIYRAMGRFEDALIEYDNYITNSEADEECDEELYLIKNERDEVIEELNTRAR